MTTTVVEIGHRAIDAQHNQLFMLIRKLEKAFYEGKGHEVLSGALSQLQHYVDEHFRIEEALMQVVGYPKLKQHKRLHWELSRQVQDLVNDMEDGQPVLSIEVIQLLRTWLVEHINQADADIANYLVEPA